MRILFIVPYTPNLIRVRSYNLIRTLAARGHHITLATLWTSDDEQAELRALRDAGLRVIAARQTKARALWNCLRALPTGEPLQAHYCWNPTLARAIGQELAGTHYDVVHVEHLRGARYGLAIRRERPDKPIVWDSVDCISYLFEQSSRYGQGFFPRVITRLELPRTRRYEARLVGQFDRVLATSPVDKAALEGLVNRQASSVKRQASSVKRQASSVKRQASSIKRQSPSSLTGLISPTLPPPTNPVSQTPSSLAAK